jgi:DNA mismatch repair ATPase MutS
MRGWLDAIGQFEALNSIAGYAYEHPDDPFPVLVDEPDALFEATGLGHPLLPDETCVRNDVQLGNDLRVWLVSGSNMSGKSTFIRAVGLNAVLAWAGAPVRARSLRISRLTVCAAIQIEDSLEDGQSRFSAEVLRLRRIMDLAAGSTNVLFLLDEVLSGTNSRDRRIGAGMIVRYLVDHGGIGFVTTHDHSLTEIADTLHPRSRNVYFEDSFDSGKMSFDYKVRAGVLTRSNALALMRSMGIEV